MFLCFVTSQMRAKSWKARCEDLEARVRQLEAKQRDLEAINRALANDTQRARRPAGEGDGCVIQ